MNILDLLRYPLTILLIAVSFLTPQGDSSEIESVPETLTEQLERISEENGISLPDNDTPLNEYDLAEYPLADLVDYFGEYTSELMNILELEYSYSDYTPSLVNDRFPIQCMRRIVLEYSDGTSVTRYYTVYKVEEGGHFYVFWSILDGGVPRIAYSGYLPGVKSIEDFEKLTENESCFDDVYAIDPSADFRMGQSGPRSYHLLNTGELLRIDYKYSKMSDTDDLIVVGMEVLPTNNDMGYMAQVYEGDLPK